MVIVLVAVESTSRALVAVAVLCPLCFGLRLLKRHLDAVRIRDEIDGSDDEGDDDEAAGRRSQRERARAGASTKRKATRAGKKKLRRGATVEEAAPLNEADDASKEGEEAVPQVAAQEARVEKVAATAELQGRRWERRSK